MVGPILFSVAVVIAADNRSADAPQARPRAREVGIVVGRYPPGSLNAITDVAGVRVGHRTVREGEDIRTGVTAIVPHKGNLFQEKVPAAIVVGNGFGKLIGSTQVNELGTLETPILLTNTLSTFAAADGLVGYMLELDGNEDVRSINPVVGETNDGYLNDIRRRRITSEDVVAAIKAAAGGPVAEGCVGAGTGTRCLGFKGGIGTASRRLPDEDGGYTVGALVQSNFGGVLTIGGAPVGQHLKSQPKEDIRGTEHQDPVEAGGLRDGSCMIVIATDAPLDARQLRRVGLRALMALPAVGSDMSHGSGDYVISFSTAREARIAHGAPERRRTVTMLPDEALSPLFIAAREATEEAIINSLLKSTTVTGYRGRTVEGVPIDELIRVCKEYGVIRE